MKKKEMTIVDKIMERIYIDGDHWVFDGAWWQGKPYIYIGPKKLRIDHFLWNDYFFKKNGNYDNNVVVGEHLICDCGFVNCVNPAHQKKVLRKYKSDDQRLTDKRLRKKEAYETIGIDYYEPKSKRFSVPFFPGYDDSDKTMDNHRNYIKALEDNKKLRANGDWYTGGGAEYDY